MEPGEPKNVDWTRRGLAVAAGLIVAAVCAAYANSLTGPFVFDDIPSIVDNETLRHWLSALKPPAGGMTVSGRPLLNLSFALNRAAGGSSVQGFHVGNLAIHLLASLTLFGLVRQTLLRPALRERFGEQATQLALAVTLIWALHPIQTEAVTYVVQRAESLMGLFYFLTLYLFVRGADAARPGIWLACAAASCAAGMATKEVMVSAPVMVLLFDRTFASASFRGAFRRRRAYYLCLACSWLLLGYLVLGAPDRGGTAGFGSAVRWPSYAIFQLKAVAHYLRLAIWPYPLVFYYGRSLSRDGLELAADGAVVALLAVVSAVGVCRRKPLGFAGAWFFLILAPSSSVVPIATEVMAEHRMYLPLAAIVAVVALLAWRLAAVVAGPLGGKIALVTLLAVAAALGLQTHVRNRVYRSELALWSDTVAKLPDNPDARNNLGNALLAAARVNDAIAQFRKAVSLETDFAEFHFNLGNALAKTAGISESIPEYVAALKIKPDMEEARQHLGIALARTGRMDEAIAEFQEALRANPDSAEDHFNLGTALVHFGRIGEATREYERALQLKADYPEAHASLGLALAASGRMPEAIAQYREALRLDPNTPEAAYDLGNALARTGHPAEAVPYYRQAIVLNGDSAQAYDNMGLALAVCGRFQEAIASFENALRLKPDDAGVRLSLGRALAQAGRPSEAAEAFAQVLRSRPESIDARMELAAALAQLGRTSDAIAEYERILRLSPESGRAQYNLGALLAGSGRLQEARLHFEEALRLMPNLQEARINLDRINAILDANAH